MAKNKPSVQSLFSEEFKEETKAPVRSSEPKKPVSAEKPAAPKQEAPEKEAKVMVKKEAARPAQVPEQTKEAAGVTAPVSTAAPKKAKPTGKDFRSSSIYLSGENVNFVKYITKQQRISQKQYLLDLLKEKQAEIEKENPLRETKILDFKQPVQAKYRSNKANSTIYSISAPADLLEYYDRVCDRDHISFSTLVDDAITVKREAFLAAQ